MANDETPAGFLSRWSRRKVEVRQGVALDEHSEKEKRLGNYCWNSR